MFWWPYVEFDERSGADPSALLAFLISHQKPGVKSVLKQITDVSKLSQLIIN